MERYLDPKADLTFKKVFGEHPDLLISFLNALLPIEDDEKVIDVDYLPAEMVPENPLKKNSIVDVRCKDQKGRQFIVEMQMIWSDEFKHRVLFNASKAYVRQLDSAKEYRLLQPVYSLNLVNETFEDDMPGTFYHHYRMVHAENSEKIIDGLQLIFVELPKFVPKTISEKKMRVLWLRFLTEIDENTRNISAELTDDKVINKALTLVKESAYSDSQLLGYEKFWDSVRVERALVETAERKGMAIGLEKGLKEGLEKGMEKGLKEGMEKGIEKGMEKGIEKGIEKGLEKGRAERDRELVERLASKGMSAADIADMLGLQADTVESILAEK